MLPQVPEAKPDDPEDVSWALSTAEAMWARGDHAEGVKWVRRAAEAASEAEQDERALELAKAAADLTGLITRQVSRASIDLEEVVPISAPSPPPVPPARPATPSKAPPKPAGSLAPKPIPTSVTKQVVTPSRPPAPLPSKTSQPPAAAGAARPSQPPAAKGKPLGTNTKQASIKPAGPAKKTRKSRDNLDAEARAALSVADTAQQPSVDEKAAGTVLRSDTAETAAVEVPQRRRSRPELGESDPTFVGHVNDIVKPASRSSAEEWDASPTQNLTGDELPFGTTDGERKTAVGSPPVDFKATMQSFPRPGGKPLPAAGSPATSSSPPATVAASMLSHHAKGAVGSVGRIGPSEQHDPAIQTTQAVRVVVWRDASGVHVAPAGTVVSAITVDAVLVALEPSADLTAWLTQKGR